MAWYSSAIRHWFTLNSPLTATITCARGCKHLDLGALPFHVSFALMPLKPCRGTEVIQSSKEKTDAFHTFKQFHSRNSIPKSVRLFLAVYFQLYFIPNGSCLHSQVAMAWASWWGTASARSIFIVLAFKMYRDGWGSRMVKNKTKKADMHYLGQTRL